MNFTLAPAKSFLTSSEYISNPLTMSLPTWANGPVIGAMNPTRNSSCAKAGVGVIPNARHAPISIAPARLANLLVIAVTPCLVAPLSLRRGRQFLREPVPGGRSTPLANLRRNAHQAARKIENDQDIHSAEHILPPRHQRAEIFAQEEDDAGADGAAHQRPGASENHHQERVDRRGQNHVFRAHDAVHMRPQYTRKPTERAGDDEG